MRLPTRLSSCSLSLCILLLATRGAAQIAPLPNAGAAYATAGEVALSVSFVRAQDGGQRFELLVRDDVDGIELSERRLRHGTRYRFDGTVDGPGDVPFSFRAELDVYPDAQSGGFRFVPRIRDLPNEYAVESLGVAYEFVDVAGMQRLLIPVFGGAEFDEPTQSLVRGRLDTGFAHSVQQSVYYADDGSGLLLRAEDPRGTLPKRFLYEVNTLASPRTLRISLDYWMPNANVGGLRKEALAPIVVQPFQFDPELEAGWFRAAKLYRSWVLEHGRGFGKILERGPLAERRDVPRWLKELDLLVTDQFGWFPSPAPGAVADPLLNLTRHKTELGADNIFVGLWNWTSRSSDKGLNGSWYTDPEIISQIQQLRAAGIRTSGYTHPQLFDQRNPFLDLSLFDKARLEDRDGNVVTQPGGGGETFVTMDVASLELAAWFTYLGKYHAKVTGLGGMYMDLPVAAGTPDFVRRLSFQEGTSYAGYEGFQNILRAARLGAAFAGEEFAVYHEAAFEWLIGSANLGQGAIDTFGRANPGRDDTRGVPYFQAIYSGYTAFWPADPALGTQTVSIVPLAYGDFREFNISRLQAEGVVLGGIPNTSEVFLPTGQLFYEIPIGGDIGLWLAHHKKTLKNAIALRKAAREWLVFGEMLNDPRIGGDEVSMLLFVLYLDAGLTPELYRKPRVHTRAWKARDESIRVVAFNGDFFPGSSQMDLARIGLPNADGLRDVNSNEFFPAAPQGTRDVVTVPVGGGEWRILRPE